MITEADVRRDLARIMGDLEDGARSLLARLEGRGTHITRDDEHTAYRMRVLAQRLRDAVAEIDDPGSEWESVHRIVAKRARLRTYLIGTRCSYIFETASESQEGVTLIEAARKLAAALEGGGR